MCGAMVGDHADWEWGMQAAAGAVHAFDHSIAILKCAENLHAIFMSHTPNIGAHIYLKKNMFLPLNQSWE